MAPSERFHLLSLNKSRSDVILNIINAPTQKRSDSPVFIKQVGILSCEFNRSLNFIKIMFFFIFIYKRVSRKFSLKFMTCKQELLWESGKKSSAMFGLSPQNFSTTFAHKNWGVTAFPGRRLVFKNRKFLGRRSAWGLTACFVQTQQMKALTFFLRDGLFARF